MSIYKARFRTKTEYGVPLTEYTAIDTWGNDIVGIQDGANIVNRFDEGLDTGSFAFYSSDPTPIPKWTKTRIWENESLTPSNDMWVKSCTVDKVVIGNKKPYYKKTVQLIELTNILHSLPLPTLCFSKNIDGTANYTIRQALQRIINQLFTPLYTLEQPGTVLKNYKKQVPVAIALDENIQGLDDDCPEMFLTECTAFDAFLRFGQILNGMPRLLNRNNQGFYVLTFDRWDKRGISLDLNTDVKGTSYADNSEIDGFSDAVQSDIKNMLLEDEKNNALTYPFAGQFKGINTAQYTMTIEGNDTEETYLRTESGCIITLPLPIAKLIKVEAKIYTRNDQESNIKQVFPLETNVNGGYEAIVEEEEWRTIPPSIRLPLITSPGIGSETTSTYSYSGDVLKIAPLKYIMQLLTVGEGINGVFTSRSLRLRITYVPIQSAKMRVIRDNMEKPLPITQIVNQSANIVAGESYKDYLQGLSDRMIGEYKVIEVTQPKGARLLAVGDILNGEVVVETNRRYFTSFVITTATTSKKFNRRSQFIDIAQEIRQWQIPASGKTFERDVLYIDRAELQLGSAIENAVNESGISSVDDLLKTEKTAPKLAYIAWKPQYQMVGLPGGAILDDWNGVFDGDKLLVNAQYYGKSDFPLANFSRPTKLSGQVRIIFNEEDTVYEGFNNVEINGDTILCRGTYIKGNYDVLWEMHASIDNVDGELKLKAEKKIYTDGAEPQISAGTYLYTITQYYVEAEAFDENADSRNYALMSSNNIALRNNIVCSWACQDNASVGVRGYHYADGKTALYSASRQTYIAYNGKAKILRFKLGRTAPTNYVFDDTYTKTGAEDKASNQTFDFTFPMSKKAQFEGLSAANTAVDFATNRFFFIEKDLREQIRVFYQILVVGKGDTIVSDAMAKNSGLCVAADNSLRLYVNADSAYTERDRKAKGTLLADLIYTPSLGYSSEGLTAQMKFYKYGYTTLEAAQAAAQALPKIYNNVAIADGNGVLYIAKNGEMSMTTAAEYVSDGNYAAGYKITIGANLTPNYMQPM